MNTLKTVARTTYGVVVGGESVADISVPKLQKLLREVNVLFEN